MEKMKEIFFGLLLLSACASGWDDCPFGLVNDTYPGDCGRYVDTNIDGLCDRSQTRPTTTMPSAASSTFAGQTQATQPAQNAQKPATGQYYLFPLTLALLAAYLASDRLSKRNILFGVAAHRKAWNVLLVLTFFGAAATGLLIALRLDQRWEIPYMADLTYWHVEAGIAMAVIGLFHCAWHSKYYLAILGKKRKAV